MRLRTSPWNIQVIKRDILLGILFQKYFGLFIEPAAVRELSQSYCYFNKRNIGNYLILKFHFHSINFL